MGEESAVNGPLSSESVTMAVKLLLLMTLFYMSGTSPDLRTTSTTPRDFRSTQEDGEAKQDNPTPPSTSDNNDQNSEKLATPPNDHQYNTASTDHNTPITMKRKATRGKRKVPRMVGWLVGTALTLASILVLIAGVALTSRGTNTTTTEQEAQSSKNCCCRMMGWMTRTSSQMPLWKSLLLKASVTFLSTVGAAVFSLVITNLLAEREESVEDTVRDILGIPEQEEGRRRSWRRQRSRTAPEQLILIFWTTRAVPCSKSTELVWPN